MPNTIFNLQLFGEEGTADVSVSSDASGLAATEADANSTESIASEGNEGEQVAPAEESFDALIKGRFKKEYDSAIKSAIDKRFKNQQNLQSRLDSLNPMFVALAQKYGVAPNNDGSMNIESIMDNVINDDSLYEQEAFEKGMSVDTLKQMKNLERENAMLKQTQNRSAEQEEWNAIVNQGENLKEVYPGFDLQTEMDNPDFGRMLATLQKSGFPNAVRTAYESVHRDEIMAGAIQLAERNVEQKITNQIKSNGTRPVENGMNRQSGSQIAAFDPSRLNKAQLEEIKKRAERGERITFN